MSYYTFLLYRWILIRFTNQSAKYRYEAIYFLNYLLSNYFICMHFLWGRKSRANRERFVIGVVLRSRRIGSWDVNLSSKVSTPFKVELDLLIVYIPFIYSQRAKSQNSCLPSISKSIKDASKFGVTLFERKIRSFCWLN